MAERRLPVGAEVRGPAEPSQLHGRNVEGSATLNEGVHFRVWAPRRKRVEVVFEEGPRAFPLEREPGGYFSGLVPGVGEGARYRYRLDGEPTLYPDPASRFQPEGVHGPSQVVDPSRFRWTDGGWRGVSLPGQVLYEMHVGTFTPEGTWESAARQLAELRSAGVTVLEVMPVAEFPGSFGWGYDGVDLFAPTRLYGTPDDFRSFVDRAHAEGLGVILDVVYNHVGPDGNYLKAFSEDYFTDRYKNEWGEAINFDGPCSGPVREFFLANAGYWVDEFHLDGLRLDATQQIFDTSPDHVLAAVARRVRAAARGRATLLVGENEPQHVKLVRPPAEPSRQQGRPPAPSKQHGRCVEGEGTGNVEGEETLDEGGYGLDALWNDDFHHSALVALTGHNEAYYSDYLGDPQEFVSAAKWGYLYQGQRYRWQKKRRGTPAFDVPPAHFVNFLQNHDQVANSGLGLRCHALTSSGRYKALTALLLLAPGTPMLFQGQEFASSSPFFYFADHNPELAPKVRQGRIDFLAQFHSLALPGSQDRIPAPHDPECFRRCKLDFSERESHAHLYALHRDLLRLRRDDPAFRAQRHRGLDGAVLGPHAFVLRYFVGGGRDRLLLVNLGRDLRLDPAPEPLLAPPEGKGWAVLWSSEDVRYGGTGTPPPETEDGWRIPGECAVVLAPADERE